MELIPVVQETTEGTTILWDGIPKVFYLLGSFSLESDIRTYTDGDGPFALAGGQEGIDRVIEWLENRVAQLKLVRLLEGK
jgi:hypothetical protein